MVGSGWGGGANFDLRHRVQEDYKKLQDKVEIGQAARHFLTLCAQGEYRIVSSGDLTDLQIAEARSHGLFFVEPESNLGWALLPWSLTTEKDDKRANANARANTNAPAPKEAQS